MASGLGGPAAGDARAARPERHIFAQSSLAKLNHDVFTALVADWRRGRILANTVTISRGFSGQQDMRLADGSSMAPVDAPSALTQTGTRVKARNDCHHFGLQGYTALA